MADSNHNSIDFIKTLAHIGDALEIIVKKGAEWYDCAHQGYLASNEMKDEPGIRVIGYISEFDETQKSIFLVPSWDPLKKQSNGRISRYYVHEKAIFGWNKLYSE